MLSLLLFLASCFPQRFCEVIKTIIAQLQKFLGFLFVQHTKASRIIISLRFVKDNALAATITYNRFHTYLPSINRSTFLKARPCVVVIVV